MKIGILLVPVMLLAQSHKGHVAADYKMTEMGAPPAISGIGDNHLQITTKSAKAQTYFDQGLNLLHCFWDFEAYRAFKEAARLDPNAAMAYWGIVESVSDIAGMSEIKKSALKSLNRWQGKNKTRFTLDVPERSQGNQEQQPATPTRHSFAEDPPSLEEWESLPRVGVRESSRQDASPKNHKGKAAQHGSGSRTSSHAASRQEFLTSRSSAGNPESPAVSQGSFTTAKTSQSHSRGSR